MYTPPAFRQGDRGAVAALVASHPLGELVTAGPGGLLASAVPMLLEPDGEGTLLGHIAKANPQRRHDGREALVTFRGPDAYVTPSWYASKAEHGKVVPTWDYVIVRARGVLTVHDDPAWVECLVRRLTDHHEAGRDTPWVVDDAPRGYIAKRLRAIVGIQIEVSAWNASWKLSQNRPPSDIEGVVSGLRDGDDDHHELADLVDAHRRRPEPPR